MSTSAPHVTIVGLGLVGTSLGLALREAEAAAHIVGHDRNHAAGAEAKKRGGIDRTDWNLISACEASDLIVLSIPVGEIETTLQAIGPHLRAGAVVVDTASLKAPVLAWAAETLPQQVHFIGGNPILPGSVRDAPRADLFENCLFCLTPSPTADERAVQVASNLVAQLRARPLFLDPAEHDGLLAAVEHLPLFLSFALLDTTTRQPAWREMRKVAGPLFEASTTFDTDEWRAPRDLWLANRENLLRCIDTFAASLVALRQALADEDAEALDSRLEEAWAARQAWLRLRAEGRSDEATGPQMPEQLGLMDMLLGGFGRRDSRREP